MNPLLFALILIVVGLAIMFLSGYAGYPVLVLVIWWIGLVVLILGVILIITPVLVWVRAQMLSMLGA